MKIIKWQRERFLFKHGRSTSSACRSIRLRRSHVRGTVQLSVLLTLVAAGPLSLVARGCANESRLANNLSRTATITRVERTIAENSATAFGNTATRIVTSSQILQKTSELEAKSALRSVALDTLKENAALPEKFWKPLYSDFPELRTAVKTPASLHALAKTDEQLLDAISLRLYQDQPQIFAATFNRNAGYVSLRDEGLSKALHDSLDRQNSAKVAKMIERIRTSLLKQGFTPEQIQTADTAAMTKKIFDAALDKEVKAASAAREYKWEYDSGKLTVSGEIGHFTFKQEISATWIAGTAAAGITITNVDWVKNHFDLAKPCIGDFCIVSRKPDTDDATAIQAMLTPPVRFNTTLFTDDHIKKSAR